MKIAVVLLQLGGPDRLESVEPFLYNLFCDPDIIDLPFAFLFRRPLAKFIARRRAPKVQKYYARIGNRSPILKLTLRQARALETALAGKIDARVFVAMRYWHPMTEAAVEEVRRAGVDRVILLPLYPHFSKTTTGSSVNAWRREAGELNTVPTSVVEEYCEHPLYIDALIENIGIALRRVPAPERKNVHLLFSAHGTPVKLVKNGDPYKAQIERTYRSVVERGKFGLPHRLCFQSKVGPQEWLRPSLDESIEDLAAQKVSHVITVPIAFVSDHSETLWEINIEARHRARALGIKHFDMTPALNTNRFFIKALADLVIKQVGR